jgi:XTP/dITP diphosphohydrolase
MRPIYFSTENSHKFAEASAIADECGKTLLWAPAELHEIQSDDVSQIVDRKAKEAYSLIRRPVFVEHTSLHLNFLNGFPAGLTKHFLKYFGDEKICEMFGAPDRNVAEGKTTIGYCDGKTVTQFEGIIGGNISKIPGKIIDEWSTFGWNRVFIPIGYNSPLSEIGMKEKNRFSMRRKALEALFDTL